MSGHPLTRSGSYMRIVEPWGPAVCEHVPYDREEVLAVIPPRGPGHTSKVHCPCCGITAWRTPSDDLSGDLCPYCGVQSVRVEREER